MGGAVERRLLIVAGEASGDRHAARLVEALRAHGPVRARGVTGPALAAAGVERVVPMDTLAVIGFTGVLSRLPSIFGALNRLEADAERFRPDVAVLVDSPGFNFRLGPALHRRGVRVFYYIAPQVWAWHPERAAQMARWVERLAVVFPFEEEIFGQAGVTTRFTGHPLLDAPPPMPADAFRAEIGVPANATLLGLLPGSRTQEVDSMLPVMLEASRRLRATRPGLVAVVPAAPGLRSAALDRAAADPAVRVVRDRTREVQAHATACAVASGTATLETALAGTPLAIVYHTGWLNYLIARRVITLPRIGLPNIVAGREVAPELIQHDFTPERLAATLAPWLDDPAARAAQTVGLSEVRARLGEPGAARRTADWLWEMMA